METPNTITRANVPDCQTHEIIARWPPTNDDALCDLAIVALHNYYRPDALINWVKWFDADSWDVFYQRVHLLRVALVGAKVVEKFTWMSRSTSSVDRRVYWSEIPELPCVCYDDQPATLRVWHPINFNQCNLLRMTWTDEDATSLSSLVAGMAIQNSNSDTDSDSDL